MTTEPVALQKLRVQASEVVAGDWTVGSGFRLVISTRALSGRRVGFVRVNGKLDRYKPYRDDYVTIYREET